MTYLGEGDVGAQGSEPRETGWIGAEITRDERGSYLSRREQREEGRMETCRFLGDEDVGQGEYQHHVMNSTPQWLCIIS